jgi:hypothetical protein
MTAGAPLVLTLQLDEQSFSYFNSLRKLYFPPERNFLSAHVTLFHHLSPNEHLLIEDLVQWSKETEVLPLHITAVKSIGRGVAFTIDCPALVALHQKMQARWQAWLTPQDRQKIWPHITVQNKVAASEAKETLTTLQASFRPFTASGTGFDLWSYEGGPWKFIRRFPFRNSEHRTADTLL